MLVMILLLIFTLFALGHPSVHEIEIEEGKERIFQIHETTVTLKVEEICVDKSFDFSKEEVFIRIQVKYVNLSTPLTNQRALVKDNMLNFYPFFSYFTYEDDTPNEGFGDLYFKPSRLIYDLYGYMDGNIKIFFDLSESISFEISYNYQIFQFQLCENDIFILSRFHLFEDQKFENEVDLFDPMKKLFYIRNTFNENVVFINEGKLDVSLITVREEGNIFHENVEIEHIFSSFNINKNQNKKKTNDSRTIERTLLSPPKEKKIEYKMENIWFGDSFSAILFRFQYEIQLSGKNLTPNNSNNYGSRYLEIGLVLEKDYKLTTIVATTIMIFSNLCIVICMCILCPFCVFLFFFLFSCVNKYSSRNEFDPIFIDII